MKITNEASPVLVQLLKEKKADGLMMEINETCCGKSPVFAIVVFDENDKPETIDGISVLIPEEQKELAEKIVIDLVNGELVVMAPEMEGGCNCHHDEEHECCGHDHDHGEGCCGGHGHGCGCHHEE
ncbi:hypothetical protein [uncultured Dubosiella sp.]|uniref:hypothetical protein n=1 Tax=uncultured Dubosiella sp. TaxID=1937011 RepID=UPI00272FA98C|nr:hypothetical protein [uncultured Dubosiella sp.]